MNPSELFPYIDHTQLKAYCTWEDITALCQEALAFHTASVCIPPSYVARAHNTFGPSLNICTVIGFPLGYSTTESKLREAESAINDGASELDMVINIGDVKNGDFKRVYEEILAIRKISTEQILKVIIETCYLTEAEKSGSVKSSQKPEQTISKLPPVLAPEAP